MYIVHYHHFGGFEHLPFLKCFLLFFREALCWSTGTLVNIFQDICFALVALGVSGWPSVYHDYNEDCFLFLYLAGEEFILVFGLCNSHQISNNKFNFKLLTAWQLSDTNILKDYLPALSRCFYIYQFPICWTPTCYLLPIFKKKKFLQSSLIIPITHTCYLPANSYQNYLTTSSQILLPNTCYLPAATCTTSN